MNPSQDRVLKALRNPVGLRSLSLPEWDLLLRSARNAGLLLRLAHLIEEAGIDEALNRKVRDHLLAARAEAGHYERMIRWEVECIRRALAGVGTKTVLLKGSAYVMAGLPAARGRKVNDVDIMVPKDRLPMVEAALRHQGWEPMKLDPYDQRYYRTWMHELPPLRHRLRKTVIDVHHTILPESGRLRPDPAKLLGGARPLEREGLWVLAPEDMVLHSAAHLFQDGDLAGGLRDLLDLDSLFRHFSATEPGFWDHLVPRAAELDLTRPLFYALHFSSSVLHTPIPERALRAAEAGRPPYPVLKLMDYLVCHALFSGTSGGGFMTEASLMGLYIRSHWLRMPPLLLARHLSFKAFHRLFADSGEEKPAQGNGLTQKTTDRFQQDSSR